MSIQFGAHKTIKGVFTTYLCCAGVATLNPAVKCLRERMKNSYEKNI